MKLTINVKQISKKQNEIARMDLDYLDGMETVRDLLTETVKIMVKQYTSRMDKGEVLTLLTKTQIEDKSASGKIGFGINYGKKRPDLDKSIQAAMECFEDGMVVLFIDGTQYESLEEQMELKEGSELTFVRMIPLAGRMW